MLFDTRTGGFGGMIVECTKNGLYIGDGWNRTQATFEEVFATYSSQNALNIHAWCIDKDENVYDYEDYPHLKELNYFYSQEIVRIPADERTTKMVLPILTNLFNQWLQASPKTLKEHISDVNDGTFQDRHCWQRAMILHASNPREYTVVIGSFGFRQPDGKNTFYVWG
jgi:hypothetical protein